MRERIEVLNEKYSDDMKGAARKVLERFEAYTLPVPIVKIMSALGFKVFLQEYNEDTLSGIIGIDLKLMNKMGTDKVISVNKKDALGHQRFTMAHELCHYIFDFDRSSLSPYYDGYDTTKANLPTESRANTFAANLLMPEELFIEKYNECKNMQEYDKVIKLALDFQVSGTAVKKRIEELKGVI